MISDLNFNMTLEELQCLRNQGYHVEVFLTFKDYDLHCPKCQKEHYEKEKILKYKLEDKTYRFWCIECGTYWEATPKHRYSVIPPMWKGDIVE